MKKISVTKKIVFSCLIVAAVIGFSYLAYYLVHYTFYDDYKQYMLGTEYKEGTEFKPITSDSDRPEELSEEYVLAAKNDSLKLYYNEVTTEVAVYSIKTGKITYSNPQGIENNVNDYTSGVYLNNMKSQLIVNYYKAKGDSSDATMDSYSYCTAIKSSDEETKDEKQYKVEAIENGIRVIYTIGKLDNAEGTVPVYFSNDTFEDVLEKLQAYDDENGTKYYKSVKNVYGDSKKKDGFKERNAGVKKRQLKSLQEALDAIGWTEQDYVNEMEKSGTEVELPVSFEIPLEYTLDGDKLEVNISTDHIVENGGGTLISVDVLPYFGAEYHTYETEDYVVYEYHVVETDVVETPADDDENTDDNASEDVADEITDESGETDSTDTEEDLSEEETKPAAQTQLKQEISENMTVTLNGDKAIVTVNDDIAGEASFASFVVKKIGVDELGKDLTDENGNLDGEVINQWSTSGGSNFFNVELDSYYVINIVTYDKDGQSIEQIKFKAAVEELPVNGYYLVPNGSGSLINLNSKNSDGVNDYNERVYGSDDVLFDSEIRVHETESVKLPVYGLHSNNKDMFVILKRGESLAEIHVQTANDETCKSGESLTNYNTVYSRYYLRAETEVKMSTTDSFIVWNDDIFDTQITQLYCFLTEENSGYSGMANYYRDYLVEQGELVKSESTDEENAALYLDIIGAVKGDVQTLGITHESVIPMTTFKQAEEILNNYYNDNINNIVVNYQGWMNDGYYHETPDSISVIRKLGGKSDLETLTSLVESKGGKVYGDMAIQHVTFSAEEFNYNLEAARVYGNGYTAAYGKTSPNTYSNAASIGYPSNLYDVLSSKYLPRYVESALDEMADIEMSGISYRDLGSVVYSDMKKTKVIHREHSKEIIEAMLAKSAEQSENIMLNGALAYTFAYADDIINAPIGDNNYKYVDTEVPFYEMVIHGYINYSGKAINLSADTTSVENILECVEYGASPHFTFTYQPSTDMKYTALNDKYATNYVNWVDESKAIYNEVNTVLSKVTSSSIISHEIIEGTNNLVRKVTYDNGLVVFINYSGSDVTVDGYKVPAKNFVVK